MKIPKSATKLLLWFLKGRLQEEVLGDLEENFQRNLSRYSIHKARRIYWYQVFNYIRPFALKVNLFNLTNPTTMYQNYLKIGIRNFRRNWSYSLINVGGLAVGMLVAVLIGLWVNDEFSFNKHFENYDTIGKLYRNNLYQGEIISSTAHVTGLGTLLASEYSDHFEQIAMVRGRTEYRVLAEGERKFTESGYFMQEEGPELFSLEMVYGTRAGLADMNSILLSWSTAKKFFGDLNPVGKTIRMDARWELEITGVYVDLPRNSEFHDAAYFAPLDRYLDGWATLDAWDNYHMYIYANITDMSSFETVNSAIRDAMLPHIGEKAASTERGIFLHPMSDWHLNSEFEGGVPVFSKRMNIVLIIAAIGLFVLALACINFVNLSTARAEKRSKEVGIRKTIGSQRKQLVMQFLTESFLTVSLAFVVTVLLAYLIVPAFNNVSGKSIDLPFGNYSFWLISLAFIFFTSLVAGSYPAFYLSSFNPTKALKGGILSNNTATPRKVLVIFQFTISLVLLVSTLGIYRQIEFGKDRPVGYVREGLLELQPRSPEYYGKYDVLRNELLQTQVVHEMGASDYSIMSTRGWNHGFDWEGKEENYDPAFNTISVTHEYGEVVGLQFVDGRDFTREGGADQGGVLINESGLRLMGIEDPIGQVISFNPGWKEPSSHTIVGVVKDMIKGSPFEATQPSVLFLSERSMNMLYIRIKEGVSPGDALPKIAEVFNRLIPSAPFDYKFADQEYEAKFREEESVGQLSGFFCLVAMLISCLGLFGLSSFTAEQRTKEIGIRKILGATPTQLWVLLSKDFILLVVIASAIAVPLSNLFLDGWLRNYEFRTVVPAWIFAYAITGALVISLLTVSLQALKAAFSNPTGSLKSE